MKAGVGLKKSLLLAKKWKGFQKDGPASHISQERELIKTIQNPHKSCRWTNISQIKDCSMSSCKNGGLIGGEGGREKKNCVEMETECHWKSDTFKKKCTIPVQFWSAYA